MLVVMSRRWFGISVWLWCLECFMSVFGIVSLLFFLVVSRSVLCLRFCCVGLMRCCCLMS